MSRHAARRAAPPAFLLLLASCGRAAAAAAQGASVRLGAVGVGLVAAAGAGAAALAGAGVMTWLFLRRRRAAAAAGPGPAAAPANKGVQPALDESLLSELARGVDSVVVARRRASSTVRAGAADADQGGPPAKDRDKDEGAVMRVRMVAFAGVEGDSEPAHARLRAAFIQDSITLPRLRRTASGADGGAGSPGAAQADYYARALEQLRSGASDAGSASDGAVAEPARLPSEAAGGEEGSTDGGRVRFGGVAVVEAGAAGSRGGGGGGTPRSSMRRDDATRGPANGAVRSQPAV
ncbi:hypothetical protein HT031_003904 [Scenedesmus sp. PABB004]|nr:hypothetical protein HT031_003904 [Scenedesmus sp. PABB004]